MKTCFNSFLFVLLMNELYATPRRGVLLHRWQIRIDHTNVGFA